MGENMLLNVLAYQLRNLRPETYFGCIDSGVNPGATSGRAERPERSHGAHNGTRSSRLDRREKWFDTDDVHHTREVVGEDVQRHLGRHLRQRLHQKVRRTHPHL
jgi:hypothetical protein